MSANNEFVQSLAILLKTLGTLHAVGEQWVSVHEIIPKGGVPYLGQEVSRETYAALWQWANENNLVITEAEWQAISSSQNGNVSKYSSGDGATTFRMPSIKGYAKCAGTIGEVGTYIKEGLPNITGAFEGRGHTSANLSYGGALQEPASGAFAMTIQGGASSGNGSAESSTKSVPNDIVRLDASKSSAIYGNSTHVTPETVGVLFGVYAFGEIMNPGELDLGWVVSQFSAIESKALKIVRYD